MDWWSVEGLKMHFCSGGELFDLYQKCGSWAEEEGRKIDSSALICIFTFRETHLIYFFSLLDRRRRRHRGRRSMWSYESCKIPNLMHRRLQRGKVSARKLRTCIDDPGRFSVSALPMLGCVWLFFFSADRISGAICILLCAFFSVWGTSPRETARSVHTYIVINYVNY